MKEFLSKIDIIGSNISITYKNKKSHGNFIGGLLTILIYCMSFAVSIYFCIQMLKRASPKAYLVSKFVDDAGRLNFDNSGMLHFIYLRNPLNEISIFNKKMINVTGIVRNEQGKVLGNYIYDKCNYDIDFFGMEEIFTKNMKERIELSICPRIYIDPQGREHIKKSHNDTDFVYPHGEFGMSSLNNVPISYTLSIYKCENSTEQITCGTDEEIQDYYSGKYFALKFIDNYFDITDYKKPIVPFINTINGILGYETVSNNWLNYLKVNIGTEDGLIFEDKSILESYKFDYRVEIVGKSNGDKQILNINFYLQNMSQFYNRSYMRLQDVCANIGGIAEFFIIIGYVINFFFDKYQILEDSLRFFEMRKILFEDKSDNIVKNHPNNVIKIKNTNDMNKYDNREESNSEFALRNHIITNFPLNILELKRKKSEVFKENSLLKKEEKDNLFNCLNYYSMCFKKKNYKNYKLDLVEKCLEILYDEQNLFNNHFEIIQIRKMLMKNEKNRRQLDSIHITTKDILNSDVKNKLK